MDHIFIKGAREHNLKNIDVRLPRNSMTVITGPSGSGKSSLAFDTIYAEGSAQVRRVPLLLCPPVPGATGKTGRRLHRGPFARHKHRAEEHQQEPPLDRRHGHGDLRLPEAALRPARPRLLLRLRQGDQEPAHAADRRHHTRPGERHAAFRARPHRKGKKRRVPQGDRRPEKAGLHEDQAQREDGRPQRSTSSSTRTRSTI